MGVNSPPRKRMRPVNENMSVLSGREVSGFREVGLVRSAEPDASRLAEFAADAVRAPARARLTIRPRSVSR